MKKYISIVAENMHSGAGLLGFATYWLCDLGQGTFIGWIMWETYSEMEICYRRFIVACSCE